MIAKRVETLVSHSADIFSRHPVAVAYLYGSEAAGQTTPLSDIDVAIVTKDELSPRERLRLELTLETELGTAYGGDFDVRVVNRAPLRVQGTVVQTGKPIYIGDERKGVEFEATIRDRYFDFLPVLRMHQRAYFDAARADLEKRGLL